MADELLLVSAIFISGFFCSTWLDLVRYVRSQNQAAEERLETLLTAQKINIEAWRHAQAMKGVIQQARQSHIIED